MTRDEQMKVLLTYDTIYKKIINKAKVDYRYKEDLLQDFYLKMLKAKNLPNDNTELLKYSKTALKFLIYDSIKQGVQKTKAYKYNVDRIDTLSLDYDYLCKDEQELIDNKLKIDVYYSSLEDCIEYEDYELYFKSILDDCLVDSFNSFDKRDREIIVKYFVIGYDAIEIADEYNILSQSVKNVIRKFRKNCNIEINQLKLNGS